MPRTLETLPALDRKSKLLNVIVETPRNCRYKYKFEPALNAFSISKLLPLGMVFPFDFGFIPSTKAADGDPLDVLLLIDEPAHPGVIVRSRLIGVIEADQTERDGTTEKNDRLIAIADTSELYAKIQTLSDLPPTVLSQIEHFFISYNQQRGGKFKVTAREGPERAQQLFKKSLAAARRKKR